MATETRVSELILRLRDEVSGNASKIRTSMTSMQSSLTSFVGALGIGLGVGALVSFGKSVIDLAGHLDDLSKQTGISGQTLSGLKSVVEESGSTIDAFAKGIFTAQKNIGQGSQETIRVIQDLGLDFDKLRSASPEDFLNMIASALGKIEDPITRNALGARLLGKSFKELGPVLSEIGGRLDEFRSKGMSDENIKKLEQFGDSMTSLKNTLQIISTQPLAEFVGFLRFLSGTPVTQLTTPADQLEDIEARLASLTSQRKSFFGGLLGEQLDVQIQKLEKEKEILINMIDITDRAAVRAKKVPLDIGEGEEIKKQRLAIEKQILAIRTANLDPLSQTLIKESELTRTIEDSLLPTQKKTELINLLTVAFDNLRSSMQFKADEQGFQKQIEAATKQIGAGVPLLKGSPFAIKAAGSRLAEELIAGFRGLSQIPGSEAAIAQSVKDFVTKAIELGVPDIPELLSSKGLTTREIGTLLGTLDEATQKAVDASIQAGQQWIDVWEADFQRYVAASATAGQALADFDARTNELIAAVRDDHALTIFVPPESFQAVDAIRAAISAIPDVTRKSVIVDTFFAESPARPFSEFLPTMERRFTDLGTLIREMTPEVTFNIRDLPQKFAEITALQAKIHELSFTASTGLSREAFAGGRFGQGNLRALNRIAARSALEDVQLNLANVRHNLAGEIVSAQERVDRSISSGSGGGGGGGGGGIVFNAPLIDMSHSTITPDAVKLAERDLLPRIERMLNTVTGKTINFRVLN